MHAFLLTACLFGQAAAGSSPPAGNPLAGNPPAGNAPTRTVDDAAIAELPGQRLADLTTPAGLRDAYTDLLRRSTPRYPNDVETLVVEMTGVYRALDKPAGMSFAESTRLRNGLKLRLEALREHLIRDFRRSDQERKTAARKTARGDAGEPRRKAAPSLAGGDLTAARAQELINLIQNTIEPDSWDVNGGKGHIMFFGQLNVLVIRATGEVHEQIGGGLDQLRR